MPASSSRSRWLVLLALALAACSTEVPCKDARPTVRVVLNADRALAQRVRSVVIALSASGERWEQTFEIEGELADGVTSIGVEIDPPPAGAFEVEVSARAFGAAGGQGSAIAAGSARRQATPDGCNEVEVALSPSDGSADAAVRDGAPDAGPATGEDGTVGLDAPEGPELSPGADGEIVEIGGDAEVSDLGRDAGVLPARLAFVTTPLTLAAGACSQPVRIELRSATGIQVPAVSTTTVALSAAPAAGFAFHSDPGCAVTTASVAIPANTSTASFHVRGTQPGSVMVNVASSGLAGAVQTETIQPGPAAVFVFDPVGSPKVAGAPFSVTIRTRDAFGNATPFTGMAALSLEPSGAARCVTDCSGAATTGAFAAGFWRGRVTATPTAAAAQLVATAGRARGSSAVFEIVAPPAEGTRPIAVLAVSPLVARAGTRVTLDASDSADAETTADLLEVSWDPSGTNPAPPPWSPWTTAKTTTVTFAAGRHSPRVAVRDQAGNIAFATRTVLAPAAAADVCVVDTDADDDDGASSCTGPFGRDGRLSILEAVRLSNGVPGRQAIGFSGPMRLVARNGNVANLTFTSAADLIAPPGVVSDGYFYRADSGELLIAGLEITAARNDVRVRSPGTMILEDVYLHDTRGLRAEGALTLIRLRAVDCAQGVAACLEIAAANASATIRESLFVDVTAPAVLLSTCGPAVALDVHSTVIARATTGISATCNGAMLIRNVTFDANRTAIAYAGGAGHVLAESIFSNHGAGAVTCGSAVFTRRDRHLFFQNASDGCVANDPGAASADPWYLFEMMADYRLHFFSDAKDIGADLGIDLNGAAPGTFFGASPDRGGRESW